jgi:glycosyltransferase involved in cell wall biosynthesis
MKLIFVCNEYPPAPHGGIGTFVHTIVHALHRAGHEVTVVGLGEEDGCRDDTGIRVVTLRRGRLRRVSWLLDRIRLFRWLTREVRALGCDLIEVPDYEGMLPFPFTACPVVVRLHLSATTIARAAGGRFELGGRLAEYLTHWCHRRWIAVSNHALRLTTDTFTIQPDHAATIYYPIEREDASSAAVPGLPAHFVLFAGYVDERKGAYLLASAARLFLPQYPDLHLVYLGTLSVEDGVPADVRIRRIVGEDLWPRVHCRGRVPRALVLGSMARARVFAFPSRLETMGLVVGEAMLSGVPVVTSACDPFPEYVRDTVTGLLVPCDDAPALSTAICRLLDEPAFAARLAQAAQRHIAERFNLQVCLESSERFYRAAIAAQGRPA